MHRRSRAALAISLALALVAVLVGSTAAHGGFPSRIALPNGWAPEGITAGRGTTVYVGSLSGGGIYKADVRTGAGRVLVPSASGPAVGVEYDSRSNRLWVAGGDTGEVRVYNAASGALLRTYTFSPVGFLNDLVVTRDAVYVTDSGNQWLDVIPLGRHGALPSAGATRKLTLSGDFVVEPGQFNGNGIVATGGRLIVCQSFNGRLFRVDPRTGATAEIDLGSANAANCDGLELQGRTLYAVQNFDNRVAVFRLGSGLRSARLRGTLTSASLDIPTTAAVQAGFLWAVNARFTTPVTPTTEYWITRLPLRP